MRWKGQYKKAMKLIREEITNLRDKVDLLQTYGPQLLTECENDLEEQAGFKVKDVIGLVSEIIEALVNYEENGREKFTTERFEHLELGST